jgi:hypothetical protein
MRTRRDWLKGAAAMLLVRDALARGEVEKGIYRVRGDVRINGEKAVVNNEIRAGDTIVTGRNGELMFVVGRDAMLVRRNSEVSVLKDGLRIVTGAVLSVFTPGEPKKLRSPTATIGIRGTAVYVEVEPGRTYVCTCYGEADLEAADDPGARETVRTTHHDEPRYIMAKGAPQMLMRAPVVNHTDAELDFLESLVGRRTPFTSERPSY